MTCRDLITLRLLDEMGEFGERRQDLRMAKMTMHVVACLRASKSGPVRMRDVMLAAIDDPPESESGTDEAERFDRAAGLK